MIKNYFILSIALFSFFAANGQVSLGIRGGVNLSRLIITPTPNNDLIEGVRFGGLVGGVADINLNSNFHLRPEIRFSSKGGNTLHPKTHDPYIVHASNKERIHYLELPLFLAYHIKTGKGEIVANAGPYAGMALGGNYHAEVHYKEEIVSVSGNFEFRNKATAQEQFDLNIHEKVRLAKRMDYGLAAGLGYKINRFMMNGTFSFSIPSIYTTIEYEQEPTTPMYKFRYNVFQLSVAYFLKQS